MSTFTKQIASASLEVKTQAKRTLERAKFLRHPAVKEAFTAIPPKLRKEASLSCSSFSGAINISVAMYDLDSFKDAKLTRVLEKFIDWETSVSEFTHNCPNKDFSFSKSVETDNGEMFKLNVFVYAYVKEDSPLCRIVVAGFTEEVVRKEIKKIVCA
jgi:hypothetical protein